MNMAVQKNHRMVVGAGVAAVAAIGIGVLAVQVRHAPPKNAMSASTTAAPAAPADTSASQQAPPGTQVSPPPAVAQGAAVTDPAASAGAAADSAPTTQTSQSTPETPKSSPSRSAKTAQPASQSPPLTDTRQRSAPAGGSNAPALQESSTPRVPQGEGAIAPLAATSSASGSGVLLASNSASTEPQSGGAAGSGNVAGSDTGASASPAGLSNGEVSTTMQARAAGADSANSDRLITSAVQSQIAGDPAGAGLAVNTINGVVVLTGSVPTADAVQHVKQVAEQVKDVKGVDATAVRVSGS